MVKSLVRQFTIPENMTCNSDAACSAMGKLFQVRICGFGGMPSGISWSKRQKTVLVSAVGFCLESPKILKHVVLCDILRIQGGGGPFSSASLAASRHLSCGAWRTWPVHAECV